MTPKAEDWGQHFVVRLETHLFDLCRELPSNFSAVDLHAATARAILAAFAESGIESAR